MSYSTLENTYNSFLRTSSTDEGNVGAAQNSCCCEYYGHYSDCDPCPHGIQCLPECCDSAGKKKYWENKLSNSNYQLSQTQSTPFVAADGCNPTCSSDSICCKHAQPGNWASTGPVCVGSHQNKFETCDKVPESCGAICKDEWETQPYDVTCAELLAGTSLTKHEGVPDLPLGQYTCDRLSYFPCCDKCCNKNCPSEYIHWTGGDVDSPDCVLP